MARKIYIVTVRWNNLPNREEMGEALLRAGSWLRFNDFVWFVKTDLDARAIGRRIIRSRLGIEQIAILEVVPENRGGWSERWIWDWMNAPDL
jgi:hypothetical protein